jgi:hypothetical protein
MTNPLSLAALPLYVNLAARLTEEQTAAGLPSYHGPRVGASDVEADIAASGAVADLTRAIRDSDGVPVGDDELEADKRNSGA